MEIKVHSKYTELHNVKLENLRKLTGNRDVTENRVLSIEESVIKVGWFIPMITINERYEIIDGQGRVEVAKRHNLPVNAMMVYGAGIKECISMNIDQKNWTMVDFIKSYSDQGNENYQRLYDLIRNFPMFSATVIVSAIKRTQEGTSKQTRSGRLVCDEETYNIAKDKLKFLESIYKTQKAANSTLSNKLQIATLLVMDYEGIDCKRLRDVLSEHKFVKTDTTATVPQSIALIDELYNYRLSTKNKVYITHLYKVNLDSRTVSGKIKKM